MQISGGFCNSEPEVSKRINDDSGSSADLEAKRAVGIQDAVGSVVEQGDAFGAGGGFRFERPLEGIDLAREDIACI
ncbi:hypothetical protein D3C87_2049130 [compost metagenome]